MKAPAEQRGDSSRVQADPGNYACVMQELLLALLGHTGDVFVLSQSDLQHGIGLAAPWACNVSVASELSFISPPDREAFNNLLRLGFHFQHLQLFVDMSCDHARLKSGSLYRRALATGISELLEVYRAAVLQLQQHLLKQPHVALGTLQHAMLEFQTLLTPLHHLVYDVEQRSISGSQLLHLLQSKVHCGIPELQSCFARLLWHCNQVLFRQLSAWMVHGLLLDRQGEFMVQQTEQVLRTSTPAPQLPMAGQDPVDMESSGHEWHSGFQVSMAALPPQVSFSTAESVLFVGKAVRVLRRPQEAAEQHDLLSREEAAEFAAALQHLQAQEAFDQAEFDQVVEGIRSKVAGHLWRLVVVHDQLPLHLAALKDYCLLARGDFWQAFLHESRSLLRLPPRLATAEDDLTVPFQQSALQSTAEQDKFFANVRLAFDVPEPPGPDGLPAAPAQPAPVSSKRRPLHVPAYDKWDAVRIEYKVRWPLHLLLTPEVMACYNALFQYLLRLKRTGLELDTSWAVLRRQTLRARGPGEQAARLPLWQARHAMAHFIANLQIYMQVDVIETQSALLAERVASAQDFKEAERAHKAFIDALIMQAFLDMKQIMQMLEALLLLCQRLCGLVQRNEGGSDADAIDSDNVTRLATDFKRRANMLYTLLQSNKLQGSQRAPFLRQFLLRLNFNSWQEREAVRQLRGSAIT